MSVEYIDIYREFSYDFHKNGESKILEALQNTFCGKVIFFDVGANVGDWSQQAVGVFQEYEGHLFELSAPTFRSLLQKYEEDRSLTLNNCALSDKSGDVEYLDYGINDGGNTLITSTEYHNKKHSIVVARSVRGDDYCEGKGVNSINFLKIDTEGSEFSVLKGFETRLSKGLIDVVQFEYGYTNGDANTLMKDFYQLLEGYGYLVGPLRRRGVQFKKFAYEDNDFKSGPNYVACLPKFRDALAEFKPS